MPVDPELVNDLARPIEYLMRDMSARARHCIENTGIEYIWQLVEKTPEMLLDCRNLGRKTLREIRDLLNDLSLDLGMVIPDDIKRMLPQPSCPERYTGPSLPVP